MYFAVESVKQFAVSSLKEETKAATFYWHCVPLSSTVSRSGYSLLSELCTALLSCQKFERRDTLLWKVARVLNKAVESFKRGKSFFSFESCTAVFCCRKFPKTDASCKVARSHIRPLYMCTSVKGWIGAVGIDGRDLTRTQPGAELFWVWACVQS